MLPFWIVPVNTGNVRGFSIFIVYVLALNFMLTNVDDSISVTVGATFLKFDFDISLGLINTWLP